MVGHCLFALEIVNILGMVRAQAHTSQIPRKLPLTSRAKDTCSQAGDYLSMAADGIRGAASLPALCPQRPAALTPSKKTE